jgi:hypothetical protein
LERALTALRRGSRRPYRAAESGDASGRKMMGPMIGPITDSAIGTLLAIVWNHSRGGWIARYKPPPM